jgi:hypothetical protein
MESPTINQQLNESAQLEVRVPRRLLLFSFAVALLAPYLARLPGVVAHGPEWLLSYVANPLAILFMSAFNAIHGSALYLTGKLSKKTPLSFWGAVASSTGYALWAHGSMNLAASSTAAIGLIFIPIYSALFVLPGVFLGFILQRTIKRETERRAIAWTACLAAIVVALAIAMQDQAKVAQREANFPIVSVNELPLTKRTIFGCCEAGRVEALAFDNFDAESGQEIANLGDNVTLLLDAATYAVKARTNIRKLECDRCVGMYPRIAAHGRGGFIVASSDGVVDQAGRILWRFDHSSFSKIVPLRLPGDGELTFFFTETPSQLQRHDAQGKVLWSFKGPVLDVEIFEDTDGQRLPAATVGKGNTSEFWLFSLDGKTIRKILLPKWANNVSSIAWPSRGHILAGGGSWVGVLDSEGKQILLHEIQGTSFRPYHGPDGVPVRFNPTEKPYLAVTSHGSSGYARSVLLIFDPAGRLIWQEEVKTLRAVLTLPRLDGKGEVLLVGGMDGVTEYKLADGATPNRQLEQDAASGASQLKR